jgi:hypothetical protein
MPSTSDVVDHTTDPDPATGLRAVAALRRLVEQLEDLQVEHARALGWSWADIAAALGVSRQAVHKKHVGHTSANEKR